MEQLPFIWFPPPSLAELPVFLPVYDLMDFLGCCSGPSFELDLSVYQLAALTSAIRSTLYWHCHDL